MMARLALLIGIGLVTAGNYAACAFKSGPNGGVYPTPPDGSGAPGAGTFRSALVLRNVTGVATSSFVFGEPIRFDFEIVNQTSSQQRVQFPDAQTHDFLVSNQAGTQVLWRWSDGLAYAQVTTELVFEPYASKTFTLVWSGVLADGTHLGAGNYRARGALAYSGFDADPLSPNEMASPLEPFTVR